MDTASIVHANLPDTNDAYPALAKSINKVFAGGVRATVEAGRLVLRTPEMGAVFETTGELVGADGGVTPPSEP